MSKDLIVYDVDTKEEDVLSVFGDGYTLFSATPIVKDCVGCFGCWVRSPGECVIKDRCSVIPGLISKSDELIIISPIVYGGYSVKIKAVLDRSIGYVLPYFRMIDGEMHHQLRYDNHQFKLTVYFYGECDEEEKEIASNLVKANAVNLGAANYEILFFDRYDSIRKANV